MTAADLAMIGWAPSCLAAKISSWKTRARMPFHPVSTSTREESAHTSWE